MSTRYYQKKQRNALKNARKGIKIFQKNKKNKRENMVVNNIKIFLKKKKIKGVSMNMNTIKISLLKQKAKAS